MFSLDFDIVAVHITCNERPLLQLNLISFLQYSSTESQKVAVIFTISNLSQIFYVALQDQASKY